MASSIFQVRTANECIRDARNIPIPQMLFDELWFEREVTILFADSNIGKTILSLQIAQGITQVHGAPNHPQTQGKIERYHRSMKNVVKLHHYYSLSDLKKAIDEYIEYYNNERYHESLNNCTPASVYNGTNKIILEQRRLLKQKSMKQRRRNHLRSKSAIFL